MALKCGLKNVDTRVHLVLFRVYCLFCFVLNIDIHMLICNGYLHSYINNIICIMYIQFEFMDLIQFFNCFNFIQFKWETKHWYSSTTLHSMQHNSIYLFFFVSFMLHVDSPFSFSVKKKNFKVLHLNYYHVHTKPLRDYDFKNVLNHKCLIYLCQMNVSKRLHQKLKSLWLGHSKEMWWV